MSVEKRDIKVWYGRLDEAEKFPDLQYWQGQSSMAKFATAWEMVLEAHALKGEDLSESRLQRAVASLQRRED